MGHIRLGTLPDTAPWRKVVELLAEDADVPAVAAATSQAAVAGLKLAKADTGLAQSLWMLCQVGLAARQPDFAAALRLAGFAVPDQPTVLDIAVGFADAVDARLRAQASRTDLG